MTKLVIGIVVTGTLMLTGALISRNVRGQVTNLKISVKDLPEYGVKIIAPGDPSFDQRAQPFLKGQPQAMADRIKPFSVILENTGRLAIVGSRLNWDIVKSDGTVVTHQVGSANPRALMDGISNLIQTTRGAAVAPQSARFVSLAGSASDGEHVDLNNIGLSFRGTQTEMEEFNRAVRQGNRQEAFNKSDVGRVLAEATSVTVSIDGVFFEDGTFVGDNKTGLFEEIKAFVDAEYDMVAEFSTALKQGKAPEEILAQVTDLLAANAREESKGPPLIDRYGNEMRRSGDLTSLASMKFSSDPYQNYRLLYAKTLVRKSEALGAERAIDEALKLLSKPRLELKRK